MKANAWILAVFAAGGLTACDGGDVNLNVSNTDNSVDNSVTQPGGSDNPCANYTDPATDTVKRGSFSGGNCTYAVDFISDTRPLTVDLTIPLITGVHIFQGTLAVGTDVGPGSPVPAADSGPTLTIQAGNTIAFVNPGDYVLITRGAKLIAEGTPTAPITFTGYTDAVTNTAGPEDQSLWGGIVLNGRGITNACPAAERDANQCHVLAEGKPSHYGGNDNADDSGVLRYVVVKHAGFEVVDGNELNGITFNAVGSGTVVENIQAYSTTDDGIEFFGGAVNVTNYVGLYVGDDSIDYSDGYIGTIENALVIHSAQRGNNCVEGDNINASRAPEPRDQAPRSHPTIRNLTCILSNHANPASVAPKGVSRGPHIREGALVTFENMLVHDGYGASVLGRPSTSRSFFMEHPETVLAAQNGLSSIANSVIASATNPGGTALPNGDTVAQWVTNTGAGAYAANTGNVIDNAPAAGAYLTPGTFYSVTAAGGVTAADDWTAGWTFGLHAGNRAQPLWFEP
jgi:hypothetical protein